MKFSKSLILFGTALLFVTSASAVPIGCDTITKLSELIAAGPAGCTHQDKLFNNFAYTGDSVGSVNATHEFSTPTGGISDIHGWLFSLAGGWTTGFNLQYDVSIIAGFPNQRIFAVKDQEDSGITPNGTNIDDIETTSPAGSYLVNVNGNPGPETRQQLFAPLALSVHTNSTFTPGGGHLATYEQQWFQTAVPEPGTLMLCGGALILAGWFGKRRRSA